MKLFLKILFSIFIITLFILFFDAGKSARDEKFIKEVILEEKGDNTLVNNKNELFVGRMFALNNIIYNKTIVGSISISDTLETNDNIINYSLNIDIYQTLGFSPDENIKSNFHGVINEIKINGETPKSINIIGIYEKPLIYDNNKTTYELTNFNFPLFGLNNVITSGQVNTLESVIIDYKDSNLFEIGLTKFNTKLTNKIMMDNFDNYPEDINKMYNDIVDILSSEVGRFKYPNEEQLIKLNNLNYNFHIFTGQDKYNYLIYIYVTFALLISIVSIYFVYIKPYIKRRKSL